MRRETNRENILTFLLCKKLIPEEGRRRSRPAGQQRTIIGCSRELVKKYKEIADAQDLQDWLPSTALITVSFGLLIAVNRIRRTGREEKISRGEK